MPPKVSKKRKSEGAAAEEALRADLECPVCYNTAFPPVKQVRFPATLIFIATLHTSLSRHPHQSEWHKPTRTRPALV